MFTEGVFIARGKEDALVSRNLVPGSEVYGEKRISVEVSTKRFAAVFNLFRAIFNLNDELCAGVRKR